MAKIAQYFLEYQDRYQPDLFEARQWDNRQSLLGKLFEEDGNIEFKVADKVYHHRTYHLKSNPNIIVMRFANVKDIIVEHDFKEEIVQSNPSCFVIIDNRKGCRRIGIQKLATSFSSTDQVAKILQRVLNEEMDSHHHIGVMMHAQRYPQAFYDLWRMKEQSTVELKFQTAVADKAQIAKRLQAQQVLKTQALKTQPQPNEQYDDDKEVITGFIEQMSNEGVESGYLTTIGVTSTTPGAPMLVDTKTAYIKRLVQYSASMGAPIQLITKDGSSYTCYIEEDAESTNKIVTHDIDTQLLEHLFDPNVDDKAPAEAKLIEFVNGMKHIVDDNETEVA